MIIKDVQENYGLGWVKIYRSILNDKIWVSQKFTRGQAWLDLLLLAKWKSGFFWVRDVKVDYKRGQITEGVINLSLRWKWSRGKTQNFLNVLEIAQQIEQQKSSVITLITITNYEQYQQNEQHAGQQDDNRQDIRQDNRQDTHKKDKKEKNDKKSTRSLKSLEERMTELELAIMEYKGEYPVEMLQAFWEYWSEPNQSRTKMRKELQKTWDTKRRLKTWADRESKFEGKNSQPTYTYQELLEKCKDYSPDARKKFLSTYEQISNNVYKQRLSK